MTNATQTLNRIVEYQVKSHIEETPEAREKGIPLDIDTIVYHCSLSGLHPQSTLNLYRTLMREWYGVEVKP